MRSGNVNDVVTFENDVLDMEILPQDKKITWSRPMQTEAEIINELTALIAVQESIIPEKRNELKH